VPPGFAPVFVEHRGIRVLRLEYTGLAPAELSVAFRRARSVIDAAPARSLRILTLLDSRFDEGLAEEFKRYSLANRPFVSRSAVVAGGFWRVVATSVKLHGRTDLMLFDRPDAALAWLTRD
jgi:hypothetical protein